MQKKSLLNPRSSISTIVAAVIIIVVIVVGVAAYYFYASPTKSTTTTTSQSSSSTVRTTSSSAQSSSVTTGSSSVSTSSTSSTSTTTSETGSSIQTLVIDDTSWPYGDLNQLTALGLVPFPDWLTYTVYQSLVDPNGTMMYGKGGVQILPDLAANWTVSSDGTTYTFNLRHNVTFSNGDPLNSYQVWGQLYGFYYLSGNSSAWLNAYDVFNMSAANFGPSVLAVMNQSGLISPNQQLLGIMENNTWPIYVTSPSSIVFHLQAPFEWFPNVLVAYVGMIFDTQYVLEHGGFGTAAAYNPYFNQHPIPGTGPYVVTQVSENAYVQFTQNPNYWGKNLTAAQISANAYLDPGHVKNVIVYAKLDDLARYTDLSTGTAQIAGIQTADWPLVVNNPDKYSYFLMPDKSMAIVAIAMNTQRYPTNITAVRQAIVHAINYTDISTKAFFGELSPMVGPEYPAQTQFYNLGNLSLYNYDPTLSQQILARANINASSLPAITFRVIAGCTFCITTAQIVQSDLSAIGITVNIEVINPAQWALPLVAGPSSYSASLADAQQISQLMWLGTQTYAPAAPTPADPWLLFVNNESISSNAAIYSNPVAQSCVNAWTNGSSISTITSLCTAAQAQVYNDAPYIWLGSIKLAFGGGTVVWNKNVVKNMLLDPVYTGQSSTAVFNTVTFVSG